MRNRGRLSGASEQRQHAGGCNVVDVVADEIAIRPGLPEARYGAIDQPRVARREFLVVDAEPLGDAGPVFLDDHVGVICEPQIDFLAGAALQINPDRFLVARQRVVRRTAEPAFLRASIGATCLLRAPPGRRSRLFDSDDIGAEVRQYHRAEGSRCKLGQVEYFDSVQWSGHGWFLGGCRANAAAVDYWLGFSCCKSGPCGTCC